MVRVTTIGAFVLAAAGLVAGASVAGSTGATAAAGTETTAPATLMETGLYAGGQPGVIDPGNRPFSPQYPLWTDGASKARWIHLPPGTSIDATDASDWEFPVGSKFWKEFAFGGRKVETRFLWKAGPDEWIFASYVWNAEGTEAVKAPESGVINVAAAAPGKAHSIPSVADCRTCHVSDRTQILGFNALQLSTDRDPNAIHGEALTAEMLTLKTLDDEGRLQPARPELVSNPPRIDAETAEERAVLGYLAGNCGACHNRRGELASLGMHWSAGELAASGRVAARAMVGHETKWQVPGVPEGESVLVNAFEPDASALVRRMKSRRPSSQMPPLGTVVQDREAVEAVAGWIAGQSRALPSTSRERP
jgi:hypothetical protein